MIIHPPFKHWKISILLGMTFLPTCQTPGQSSKETNIPLHILKQGYPIYSLAFSPNGKILAVGSLGLRLWNVATGQLKATAKDTDGFVSSLDFSPDGRLVATGSSEDESGIGSLKLWDSVTGNLIKTLSKVASDSVAFSPDGKTLASIGVYNRSEFPQLKLWNLQPRKSSGTQPLKEEATRISFSRDGKLWAVTDTKKVIVGQVRTGKVLRMLRHKGVTSAVFLSSDRLASISDNIDLWDIKTGLLIKKLAIPTSEPQGTAFSPDGKIIAVGGGNLAALDQKPGASSKSSGTITIWAVDSGKLLQTLEMPEGNVIAVTFSPDSKLLASGSDDGTVKLWRVK